MQEGHHGPDSARERIAHLEDRIEALRDSIERCRKISLGAKIAIGAGAGWLALMVARIAPLDTTAFFASVTAILGGVVLLGSNATTWTQKEDELRKAEALRAETIGGLSLQLVHDAPPTLH